jgi:hypothetical protein
MRLSMESFWGRNRLRNKAWSIVLVLAFFCFTSACSHSPKTSTTQDPYADMPSPKDTQTSPPYPKKTPWWEKPEYEWAIVTLLVIGISIAIGATIAVASGPGGLRIGVSN